MSGTKFLTLAEAAAALRVHPNTARLLIKAGRLRAYRIHHAFRVRECDLLTALEPVEPARPAPVEDFLSLEARLAPSARKAAAAMKGACGHV